MLKGWWTSKGIKRNLRFKFVFLNLCQFNIFMPLSVVIYFILYLLAIFSFVSFFHCVFFKAFFYSRSSNVRDNLFYLISSVFILFYFLFFNVLLYWFLSSSFLSFIACTVFFFHSFINVSFFLVMVFSSLHFFLSSFDSLF